MSAGLLGHRVTVEEAVSSQDATGDPVVTWVTRAVVWGSIDPIRAREALMSAQLTSEMDTKIVLRWAPVVDLMTEKWRLRNNGVIYNIVSVVNVGMNDRQLELLCKSGKNTG